MFWKSLIMIMWFTLSRLAQSWVLPSSQRLARSSTRLRSSTTTTPTTPLRSIQDLREQLVGILNQVADPKQVAEAAACKKLKKLTKKNPMSDAEQDEYVAQAVAQTPTQFGIHDTAVTLATRPEFGDYQCNAALSLGGRPVAERIMQLLDPQLYQHEIAGPGFINFRYADDYLVSAVQNIAGQPDSLSMQRSGRQRIVVDYSSPNIAKEMHVGHLRSTIIGDTLSNVLEFLGHTVIRLNHVGDWGTQFGMLVEHLSEEYPQALDPEKVDQVDLGDLVLLYKAAKKRFDQDDDFKQRAREGVVKLQAGDPASRTAWEALCAASRVEFDKIYDILNIQGLEERGESFYNPFLSNVVQELEDMGLAEVSEGAKVVFLDKFAARDGTPFPVLVQKSDGGYNYATTDLAAIRHRTQFEDGEGADRVLYVTDAGQSSHFEQVFEVARMAKFVPDEVSLEHVPFGLVQGQDGKKFATRSGDTVKLKDLLDESIRIASDDLDSRNGDFSEKVAEIVGIGAVKYADLSMNRESNYKFSYERMLSLNGNTAPYMLYAYARICGIVRKAVNSDGSSFEFPEPRPIEITHPTERELLRTLVKVQDVIVEVEANLYPNRICDYLFEVSQRFNQFYENCSVNNAETPELKESRLTICTATANVLKKNLELLGIPVVEKL